MAAGRVPHRRAFEVLIADPVLPDNFRRLLAVLLCLPVPFVRLAHLVPVDHILNLPTWQRLKEPIRSALILHQKEHPCERISLFNILSVGVPGVAGQTRHEVVGTWHLHLMKGARVSENFPRGTLSDLIEKTLNGLFQTGP